MKIKKQYLHILIIVLGIIFISIPIFHNNLWFDESYSVSIASKSFIDIWRIGSNDVHPILYYWILHIIYLIFGTNLYAYRILSMIPIAILGILGYTHIKKDFGENVGLLFSFFILFLPVNCVYSGEIRMYTLAMIFVTLMSIYAYRIYKKSSNKNWIIFATFSLLSAYTHYYALVTAGVINLILFIYLLKKSKKENKIFSADLKRFIVSAIIQIALYMPWVYILLSQVNEVSEGFWIADTSFKTLVEIFNFQFTGNLDITFIPNTLAIVFGITLIAYTIYSMIISIKNKTKENLAGFWSIGIYLIVLLAFVIISIKMPILYPRYFLNLTGLFIFFMAYFIAKGGNKVLTICICTITLIVATYININIAKMNYDLSNNEPLNYIKQNLQNEDMIIFGNEHEGFVVITQIGDVNSCFYDKQYWNKEQAYKAYGENMITIKELKGLENYKGRIWIINSKNHVIYDEIKEKYEKHIQMLEQKTIDTKYHNYCFAITLINKN